MEDATDELTLVEAAAAMLEMERVGDRVQARIHGLTRMFWGIVVPAIFESYSYAARYLEAFGPNHPSSISATLGAFQTACLWRSS